MTVLVAGGHCRRCLHRRRSDVIVEVSVHGAHYEIPLCESCAMAFDRDIGSWLRWATEVGDPSGPTYEEPEPDREQPAPVRFGPRKLGTVDIITTERPTAGRLRPGVYKTVDRGLVKVTHAPGGGYTLRYKDKETGEEVTISA